MEYIVQWTIDVDADSPREAAEMALAIQRRPDSSATVFEVTPVIERRGVSLNTLGEPETIDLDGLS